LNDKDDLPDIKMDYKGAIKFSRNNLQYLSDTLAILAPIVNELEFLRMAFLVFKIIMNVWRMIRQNGAYW